jgi:hypothetical protein
MIPLPNPMKYSDNSTHIPRVAATNAIMSLWLATSVGIPGAGRGCAR